MSSPTVEISKEFVLPVVVVGKDRTRMTCAVIDHLKAHIKNATPYFICVSDRSRPGHDAVVEDHLKEIGETEYDVLHTIPDQGRYGWGCAINLGLQRAFEVYKEADFALVVDNDWLLQRDLDMEKYDYAFALSEIGAVTFKSVNPGTNVSLAERKLDDGSVFLLRDRGTAPRYSFTAEIGCMLITRRLRNRYGNFKENCRTDETEWAFCDWYNSLSPQERGDSHLWFATDQEMFHEELNGENHVFTHVGLVSQHEGPHKWDCPEEYKYLSDDSADEQVCKGAVMNDLLTIDDSKDNGSDDVTIHWERYFDRVYCIHYLPQENKLPRLKRELARVGLLDSPVFEFRYTSECRYDLDVCDAHKAEVPHLNQAFVNIILEIHRILEEAIHFNYSRILLMENDIAFLKDVALVNLILDNAPRNFGLVQYDKFVNDGPMLDVYRAACEKGKINDYFVEYRQGVFSSAACFSLDAAAIRELKHLIDETPNATDIYFQRMTCRKAFSVPNVAIQVFSPGAWSIKTDGVEYMHKVYKNGDVKYEDYNLPDGYTYGSLYDGETDFPSCDKALRAEVASAPSPQHRKFISVYAIAKNEASVARRWYDCVKEADEVCVLDTGSTDDTVEILRSLGAKVTVKTYEDWSFAVARNDSMSLVSPEADILFTLDLDETIAPGWRKKLEDAWVERERSGISPTGCVYKYIWSFNPDGMEAQSFSVRKIHAKGQGKWKYRCHELLTEVDDSRAFFLDGFVVEHHQNRQTNRSKYLPLLEKDAKEMPDDDRSAYYYARELMYMGRWQESLDEFKRHLSLPSARWAAERASSMRNIASCYGQLGNKELCELWLRKSADEDPTNRESTFRLGEIAMEQKDYPAAVAAFRRCLAIEKPSLEYISVPIVWSARPWFLYAQALWWTGDWKGAEKSSRKALEIEPHNPEVRSQYVGMAATRKKFNR